MVEIFVLRNWIGWITNIQTQLLFFLGIKKLLLCQLKVILDVLDSITVFIYFFTHLALNHKTCKRQLLQCHKTFTHKTEEWPSDCQTNGHMCNLYTTTTGEGM